MPQPLSSLHTGDEALIFKTEAPFSEVKFISMGLIPGNQIRLLFKAPFGGPLYVRVNGVNLILRLSEANWVSVQKN